MAKSLLPVRLPPSEGSGFHSVMPLADQLTLNVDICQDIINELFLIAGISGLSLPQDRLGELRDGAAPPSAWERPRWLPSGSRVYDAGRLKAVGRGGGI
jgi:hypothetical protein